MHHQTETYADLVKLVNLLCRLIGLYFKHAVCETQGKEHEYHSALHTNINVFKGFFFFVSF